MNGPVRPSSWNQLFAPHAYFKALIHNVLTLEFFKVFSWGLYFGKMLLSDESRERESLLFPNNFAEQHFFFS